ncbi:MAG: hypothetical protein KKC03_13785 [Bacteroidetes bacterium]|nr:hypothetical protein [Bacteroidota bacterium]
MKIFFAGSLSHIDKVRRLGVKNFLSSFIEGDRIFKCFNSSDKIILDSGAFSVWNKGVKIDINKYKEKIKLVPKNWIKVSLDVIPKTGSTSKEIEKCCDESLENFLFLYKADKNILPVFHYGESSKYLKKYLDRCGYIGLSPANDTMEVVKRRFLSECFSIVKDSCKTHGFGYCSSRGLTIFPFYSIDSTTWLNGGKYGEIHKFRMGNIFRNKSLDVNSLLIPLNECSLLDKNDSKGTIRSYYNLLEWIKFEKFVTELWEKRGVEWND